MFSLIYYHVHVVVRNVLKCISPSKATKWCRVPRERRGQGRPVPRVSLTPALNGSGSRRGTRELGLGWTVFWCRESAGLCCKDFSGKIIFFTRKSRQRRAFLFMTSGDVGCGELAVELQTVSEDQF